MMNEDQHTLDDLYNVLLQDCKRKNARDNLSLLNEVLQEISKGTLDFSISNVGAMTHSRGGINSQSIRNSNGKRYRTLIDAYQRDYPKPEVKNNNITKNWVENISDPASKFMAKDLIAENKKLKAEINTLRSFLASNEAPIINIQQPQENPQNALPQLTNADSAALKKAINSDELNRNKLTIGSEGEIRDQDNKRILPRGFVTAIEKILTVNDNDQ
jgi:hypothetical protein